MVPSQRSPALTNFINRAVIWHLNLCHCILYSQQLPLRKTRQFLYHIQNKYSSEVEKYSIHPSWGMNTAFAMLLSMLHPMEQLCLVRPNSYMQLNYVKCLTHLHSKLQIKITLKSSKISHLSLLRDACSDFLVVLSVMIAEEVGKSKGFVFIESF